MKKVIGMPWPTPGVISQELLAEFRELDKAHRDVNRKHEKHRKLILSLIKSGKAVEKGALDLTYSESPRQLISFDTLVPVVGQADAEWLRARVEPTVYRHLAVRPVDILGACDLEVEQ